MSTRRTPQYFEVDGFRLDDSFLPERFLSATKFKPELGDVIVATYPKSGTTWMCHILLLILNRGNLPLDDEYFKRCVFLEYTGAEGARNMIKPGCIKTHLPFDRITFSNEAKYIYVARHPRDCVVSFYYHTKHFPNYYFTDGSFDDFFELFVRGETDFNDYFDNLISWYEQKDQPNVFFTTFEAMKADHSNTVLKVAEFLGPDYYFALVENDSQLLKEIVFKSSFGYMKENVNKLADSYYIHPSGEDEVSKTTRASMDKALSQGQTSEGSFVRDGKVGSGKIMLSADQEMRLRRRIHQKTDGYEVMSLWNSK